MALASLNTSETANKGRAVELIHPATQTTIGIRFYVMGADSAEFKRIQREQETVRMAKQKRTRGGYYFNTPEESEANALDLLTGLTTGWDEDIKDETGNVVGVRQAIELKEGEFVPFSKEAVKAIYTDLGFAWIREQIDSEMVNRRDFLPSAKGH